MKAYKYTGQVHQVGALQTWPSGFAKRLLVLRDQGESKWPAFAAFEFTRGKDAARDRTKELDGLRVGDVVEVEFYIDARENPNKPGQWFTANRAASVARMSAETPDIPMAEGDAGGVDDADMMPF